MTDPAALAKVTARRCGLLLALLTLAGFALRLPLLSRFPLREDEAIYGYWALHGWFSDPFFLQVWPDKPPIFLWLLGLAFQLWGHAPPTAEVAARWVNIFASTLTIPVLAAIARRWWDWPAAVATAALAALNPFAISFAATVFTDPVLVLAGSLALALAVRERPLWSGVWLGVAIMTKQQGMLFLPLVLAVLVMASLSPRKTGDRPPHQPPPNSYGGYSMQNRLKPVRRRVHASPHHLRWWVSQPARLRIDSGASRLARFLMGLLLVIAPILYWDSLRWAVAPSPWDLGATNVGGVTLLPPGEWPERAVAWGQLAWYLLASPWAWGVYALAVIGAAMLALRRRAPAAASLPALLLACWAGGFLLLHAATNVQVWDRYLLPLIIPLALLGGWAAAELAAGLKLTTARRSGNLPDIGGTAGQVARPTIYMALSILLLIAALPAWRAAQGRLPIGGDHGDYAGLNEALAVVNGPNTLLFHRELGWHARFALFDAVRSGEVQLRYYPSSVYLADSAAKAPHKRRYVIAPDWSPLPDLPMQLAMRGLWAHVALRAGHFTVYRIDEQPGSDASWRVCAPHRAGPFDIYYDK